MAGRPAKTRNITPRHPGYARHFPVSFAPNFAVFLQQMGDAGRDFMRLIGHLKNESSAKTLGDYLVSLDIRNLVEPDAEGWAIWVYSEDQIEAGRQALSNYLHNPGDSKFEHASQNAAVVEERKRREKAKFDERVHTPDPDSHCCLRCRDSA
jgi:hypothetical protein